MIECLSGPVFWACVAVVICAVWVLTLWCSTSEQPMPSEEIRAHNEALRELYEEALRSVQRQAHEAPTRVSLPSLEDDRP
jgi:hypothetical protein